MDVIFNSIYARACMGAGLSVLTGVRAFLPVAFLALYSRLEFASAPNYTDTVFAFLEKTWVIALLFALALIELAVDKIFVSSALRDQIMQPIRIALGGLVFAVAMSPGGWIAMAVSGFLGLIIAGLADHVRRSARAGMSANATALVLISFYEDVAVLIGTLLFVLVPLIGALLACFLGLLFYRVRTRRSRKHKGLRILKG